jgi:hypothetical protein
MLQPAVAEALAKRRDRAISAILRVKEREVDSYVPPEVSARLRKTVLDQINDLTDYMTDVVGPFQDGVLVNELWLQKLDEIHEAVVTNGNA